LRKLLLWTAVVAVLLGVGRSVGVPQGVWLLVWVGWILAVGIIRSATNPVAAGIVSVVLGGGCGVWEYFLTKAPIKFFNLHEGILAGCVSGLVVLAVAELIYHAVNWVDKVLETK
jgi:hypothetical protein